MTLTEIEVQFVIDRRKRGPKDASKRYEKALSELLHRELMPNLSGYEKHLYEHLAKRERKGKKQVYKMV